MLAVLERVKLALGPDRALEISFHSCGRRNGQYLYRVSNGRRGGLGLPCGCSVPRLLGGVSVGPPFVRPAKFLIGAADCTFTVVNLVDHALWSMIRNVLGPVILPAAHVDFFTDDIARLAFPATLWTLVHRVRDLFPRQHTLVRLSLLDLFHEPGVVHFF